jgi:hypothetical protein
MQVVTLARGPLDRLLGAGTDPDRRMRLLEDLGLEVEIADAAEAPFERDPIFRPETTYELDPLGQASGALLPREAETFEFLDAVSGCR